MNTIRQPRKRPRFHSVNFRVFGWLIRMEVARELLYVRGLDRSHEQRIRAAILRMDGRKLRAFVGRVLRMRARDQVWQ